MTKLEWQAAETRAQRACQAAEEIVARMGLGVPVDPQVIAADEEQMLRCKGGHFRKRFDGQLEYHPSKRRFVMFYNTKYDLGLPRGEHHPRTRFSIAHELGHYFLPHHRAFLMGGGRPHPSRGEFAVDVTMEREADSFAAGLLMPSPLARPLVNEDELSLATIDAIARHFSTSLVSTALRCVQLSHFPCAVVGLRDGAVAWRSRSQALIDAGLYPPEKGHTGSANTPERWNVFQKGLGQADKATSVARDWFRAYDRGELERMHVTEHYLPVPSMDTLIVLLTVPEDELPEDVED